MCRLLRGTFGQAITANVAVQLEPSGGTLLPGVVNGMAFDSAGDLFLSRDDYEDLLVSTGGDGSHLRSGRHRRYTGRTNPGGALTSPFQMVLRSTLPATYCGINNGDVDNRHTGGGGKRPR